MKIWSFFVVNKLEFYKNCNENWINLPYKECVFILLKGT